MSGKGATPGQPPRIGDVAPGQTIGSERVPIQRINLVMYAGASGDFNVIHWNERLATMFGLPNVIAHGMLTMAEGARVVTDWLGDPGLLFDYSVRFTKPVVVPDDDKGALVEIEAVVAAVEPATGQVTVEISARSGDDDVLGQAVALVRLPE